MYFNASAYVDGTMFLSIVLMIMQFILSIKQVSHSRVAIQHTESEANLSPLITVTTINSIVRLLSSLCTHLVIRKTLYKSATYQTIQTMFVQLMIPFHSLSGYEQMERTLLTDNNL